jgi:hypothetical protein
VLIIFGYNAIDICVQCKLFLRSQYCEDRLHTLMHCSDSLDDFYREYDILFPNEALPVLEASN